MIPVANSPTQKRLTFTPNLDPFHLSAAFLQPQHHPTNNMNEPEPRSAKDAPHVKKTLEHADDLYDVPGNGEHEYLVESYDVRERLLVISDQIAETAANKIRRVYEYFDPNQEGVWIDVRDV
ncbi:hypothetical protein M438DRAFT_337928 [Aureobasidium pullulans EXF-150]|uniref:Uncharacterized protein n=1 Tax=Aureobasidium pullulans EXF-150 TaxID=1043002 RepID=A0A074XHL0_AURPU|nr:uncharacterized protein M438DRAFT_337928 [Aureobasidium pullulans EXF-150]KEQ81537.1 hypothetical protein M438DRAFT_337928 [Aureobasidium pullulans EXF-150]